MTSASTATPARDAVISEFLAAAGLAGAMTGPLAGDASNRRYLRIRRDAESLVLMDAPPATNEPMTAFVAVTDWLRSAGLSAPAIVHADLERGLLLLEDLGDALYARILARDPAPEAELYGAAVDLLADLAEGAAAGRPAPAGIAPYDAAAIGAEAALAPDWWVVAARAPLAPDLRAEYDALVAGATAEAAGEASVTVLRDYHAENLIWLPDRTGAARVGLLDYQDALTGHPAYDLVSLLEDARRDTSDALRSAMLARYLDRRGLAGADAEAFRAAYAALGAQRNLKIVGIFARLALRDRKPRYLELIPRVWAHLGRDLAHPALAGLRAFVELHVPAPEPATLDRVRAAAAEEAAT